jgi:glycosyltransferase involved in cell wall biosynthesis
MKDLKGNTWFFLFFHLRKAGSSSMKIAQVYSGFGIDGISRLMLNTSKVLSKLGHTCSIITPRGILFHPEITSEKWDTRFQIYVFAHLRSLIKLIPRIKSLKLDVIHVHSYWIFPFTNFFLLFGRFFARKVIWTPQLHLGHQQGCISKFNPLFRALLKFYYLWMGPHLARKVDVLVACTRSEAKLFHRWGVKHVVIIPTPVDDVFFEKRRNRRFEKPFRLLYVGRVSTAKGIDTLIQAMKCLSKLEVSFLLHIVGPKYIDFSEDRLIDWDAMIREAKLDKIIVFMGPILNRTELRDFYLASHIFVFPSKPLHAESFPMVILEALATGLPIVSTNVGYVSEMIEHGKNGFVVPPNDPKAMAQAIYELIKNPEFLRKMMKCNYEKGKKFRMLDYATNLVDVYC